MKFSLTAALFFTMSFPFPFLQFVDLGLFLCSMMDHRRSTFEDIVDAYLAYLQVGSGNCY